MRPALALLFVSAALAQPAFEVTSVKPAIPDPSIGMRMTMPPGRIVLEKVTLRHAIKLAYNLEDWQLVGGPKWVEADPYDIEGKAAANTVFEQRRLMLQKLLADRFQLQMRREAREG